MAYTVIWAYGVQHLVTTKNVQKPISGIKKKKKERKKTFFNQQPEGSCHVLSSIIGQYISGAFGAGPYITQHLSS